MKFNIHINQERWKTLCSEADFRHAILFDAIKAICNSVNPKISKHREDGYTWISSKVLLDEIPMMKITTKAGLSPLIKQLNEWGMLAVMVKPGSRKYYKVTEKAEQLERGQPLRESNATVNYSKRYRSENLTDHITIDQDTRSKEIVPQNGTPSDVGNKNGKTKWTSTTPMDIDAFVHWCSLSTQEHIQIIGEWANTKASLNGWRGYENYGQWQGFIKRNLRPAKEIVPYRFAKNGETLMKKTVSRMEIASDEKWLKKYTLETVLKFLDEACNEVE